MLASSLRLHYNCLKLRFILPLEDNDGKAEHMLPYGDGVSFSKEPTTGRNSVGSELDLRRTFNVVSNL